MATPTLGSCSERVGYSLTYQSFASFKASYNLVRLVFEKKAASVQFLILCLIIQCALWSRKYGSENISQKFHDQWKIDWVTLIYFKLQDTGWKTDFDEFVDEFDSQHDNRRIKLLWGGDDIKFKRRLCKDLCQNYIAHCLNCLNLFRFRDRACFAYD